MFDVSGQGGKHSTCAVQGLVTTVSISGSIANAHSAPARPRTLCFSRRCSRMSRSKALMLWPTSASASRCASRFTCAGGARVQPSTGNTAGPLFYRDLSCDSCRVSGMWIRMVGHALCRAGACGGLASSDTLSAVVTRTSVVSSAFSLASASSMAPPLRRPAGLLLASRTAASKPVQPPRSTAFTDDCMLGWYAQRKKGSVHARSRLSTTSALSLQQLSEALACGKGVAIQLPDDAEVLEAALLPPVILQAPKQKSLHATQHCVRPRLGSILSSIRTTRVAEAELLLLPLGTARPRALRVGAPRWRRRSRMCRWPGSSRSSGSAPQLSAGATACLRCMHAASRGLRQSNASTGWAAARVQTNRC